MNQVHPSNGSLKGVDNPALYLEDHVVVDIPRSRNSVADSDTKSQLQELEDDIINTHVLTSKQTSSVHSIQQEEDESNNSNFIIRAVVCCRSGLLQHAESHKNLIFYTFLVILFTCYNAYFVAAVHYAVTVKIPFDWCGGHGFLIILTIAVYLGLIYFLIIKRYFGKRLFKCCLTPCWIQPTTFLWSRWYVRWFVYLVILALLVIFLVLDTEGDRLRLVSGLGIIVFILFGFIFSTRPDKIVWRTVFWGLALQFVFAMVTLRWTLGRDLFLCLGEKVKTFLQFTDAGSGLVYGYLVTKTPDIFAFKVLTSIFFIAFIVSMLYHWGVMQWIIKKISWILEMIMGTTACESMNAAANIFLGQTEAPLLIKPYLILMTKSEIHAVLTGGFATIAGAVMAAYIHFGVSASHLITASVMSAPAALAFAKLFYPETEVSKTNFQDIKLDKGTDVNVLAAAANGASNATFLVLNIIANLIAFLAMIAFLNAVVGWFGILLGADNLSFEWILGKMFIPIAWLLGVPSDDCESVALLIGLKTVSNEFVAYQRLGQMQVAKLISPRAEAIATYALCGFANPGSIGIQIGGMSAMCPERAGDISQVIIRAFISGTISCFLTACVAGLLITESSTIIS